MPDGLINYLRFNSLLTGLPNERKAHQGVHMIGTLEHQPIITLQFTVISGEEDIGMVVQIARFQIVDDPLACLIDQFVFDMRHCIDFAHLISGHVRGHIVSRRLKITPQACLVITEPVFGLSR